MTKNDARAWLSSIAGGLLPKTCRNYSWRYVTDSDIETALGLPVDPGVIEGKLVAMNEDFLVVKVKRTELTVVDRSILPEGYVPSLDSVVRITPYGRRRWDDSFLRDPRNENGFTRFVIGEYKSYLPVDKATICCPELREMMDQVETLRFGRRTIVQMLIDAKANLGLFSYQDPVPEMMVETPPQLQFMVDTPQYQGPVTIEYDAGADLYNLHTSVEMLEGIYFDSLAETISALISVEGWNLAQVEVLKPGKRSAKA